MSLKKTILKIIVFTLFTELLVSCKHDKDKLTADVSSYNIIIKTDSDIDSLSMYPDMVPMKFLDTNYTSLFKGYLKNGEVIFTSKKLPHPYMFNILEEKKGISDMFFVDNGTTEISLSYTNYKGKISIQNELKSKSQIEYEELKILGLNEIDSLREKSRTAEQRANIKSKRDSAIVNYIHKNPNSYVPLWLMVNYITNGNERYNKIYDESLHLFSEDIKRTGLFNKLKSYIEDTKKNLISNKLLSLKSLDLKPVDFKLNAIKNKEYILLDFWFSNCAPCLAQMPNYIPLYQKYKDMGFEIVSISTDKTNKIQDWKDVIQERNFNWIHYLDENRVESDKLYITSFPTTFLIDKEGSIIEKNITLEKLRKVLVSKFGK